MTVAMNDPFGQLSNDPMLKRRAQMERLIIAELPELRVGAQLTRTAAASIASLFGYSSRTVYRTAARLRADATAGMRTPSVDEEATTTTGTTTTGSTSTTGTTATGTSSSSISTSTPLDAADAPTVGTAPGAPTDAIVPEGAPRTLTFLERLEVDPYDIVFDDEAMALVYLADNNLQLVYDMLIKAGYRMASYATFWRKYRTQVRQPVRRGARFGLRDRASTLLHVRHSAAELGAVYELDEFTLELEVTVGNGAARIVRPHLLLLVDDHSRFITAWALLDHAATAADTLALFADAFERRPDALGHGIVIGGVPERLVTDNARAFRSGALEELLVQLPLALRPAPIYTPTAKGIVERTGQTIKRKLTAGLAGHVSEAQHLDGSDARAVDACHYLHWPQLVGHARRTIEDYNYVRSHRALDDRTPFEVWSTAPSRLRSAADVLVAPLWLAPTFKPEGRRVQPTGVLFENCWYVDPALEPYIGKDVQVRALHHRRDHIAVFDDETFLCFAACSATLTDDERHTIMTQRRQALAEIKRHGAAARRLSESYTELVAEADDETPTFIDALRAERGTADDACAAARDDGDGDGEGEGEDGEVKRAGRRPRTRRSPTNDPSARVPVSGTSSSPSVELGAAAFGGDHPVDHRDDLDGDHDRDGEHGDERGDEQQRDHREHDEHGDEARDA